MHRASSFHLAVHALSNSSTYTCAQKPTGLQIDGANVHMHVHRHTHTLHACGHTYLILQAWVLVELVKDSYLKPSALFQNTCLHLSRGYMHGSQASEFGLR